MTQTQAPVQGADRIQFLDILRGFAVMGILAMNIQSFSMPGAAYFNPTAWGDLDGLNRLVWFLANSLANQKFMTIFSMLFGAGVMLMYERSQAGGRPFGSLHYRRMFFLLLFGLAHAYLLWSGDILYSYALSGMLLFLFRKARPGWLLASGLMFLLVGSSLLIMSGFSAPYWPPEQLAEFERDFRPSISVMNDELTAFRGSWLDGFHHRAPESLEMQLFVFPFYMIWRALGAMLIGMALFKWGFITGKAGSGKYRLFLGLALLVGLPLTIWGGHRQLSGGWDPVSAFFLNSQWGYWGSLLLALGWMSALLLLVRAGILGGLTKRLAACGRMAFTNYIMQSALCCLIFYGYGLGLIGSVPRVGQAGIAVAIWLFQLWLSPVWLAKFRYGPLEWAWRSLSYGARQPMRTKVPSP